MLQIPAFKKYEGEPFLSEKWRFQHVWMFKTISSNFLQLPVVGLYHLMQKN